MWLSRLSWESPRNGLPPHWDQERRSSTLQCNRYRYRYRVMQPACSERRKRLVAMRCAKNWAERSERKKERRRSSSSSKEVFDTFRQSDSTEECHNVHVQSYDRPARRSPWNWSTLERRDTMRPANCLQHTPANCICLSHCASSVHQNYISTAR